MKDFKTLSKELKKVKKVELKDNFNYLGVKDFLQLSGEEKEQYKKEREAHEEERKKVEKENEVIELKKAIIKHNLLCTLYEEVAPVIIDILSKYKNKPLGDKTENKIQNEFFNRTGHKMYFDRKYSNSDYINVYTLDDRGYSNNGYKITISIQNNEVQTTKVTNDNNRIKDITDIKIYCRTNSNTYITNINKYVKDYINAYIKAYNAQQELKKLCEDCSKYVLNDLFDVYYLHNIREKFL
jgi:hypothetical protein